MDTFEQTKRIMTCGSVDNGKSTLIGRMMFDSNNLCIDRVHKLKKHGDIDYSKFLDGLKLEQSQGITIDVSYQFFSTKSSSVILADVPGHKQYTRNMVTAASNSDIAILVLDASKKIDRQTIRHAYICSMFGIKKLIVVLNKMDVVNWKEDRFLVLVDKLKCILSKMDFEDIKFIPTNALVGDNIVRRKKNLTWYEGNTLFDEIDESIPSNHHNLPFRLPIQLTIKKYGKRFYMGTIVSGKISVGDKIVVNPQREITSVRKIFEYGKETNESTAGKPVSICVMDDVDIVRGDILTKENDMEQLDVVNGMIIWMSKDMLNPDKDYIIKCCTRVEQCRIIPKMVLNFDELSYNDSVGIEVNDISKVEIFLHSPICFDKFSSNKMTGNFILVNKYSNETVGAGIFV